MNTRACATAPLRVEDVDPCGACGARPHGLCADLDGPQLSMMAAGSDNVAIAAKQALFHEGDDSVHVFNVVEGAIKLYRLLPDGRRQITGFLYCGDFLGLVQRRTAAATAEALTPVIACRFRRPEFERLLDQLPALEKRLVAMAGDELLAAQEQILLLGRKTARERVASFLVATARRQQRLDETAETVRLPMTRLDIADYLGLTIETVSRTFSQFRAGGLIRLLALDLLRIQKPAELEAIADATA